MSFNDDEQPVDPANTNNPSADDSFDDGEVTATIINKKTAPLEANEFNVMMELTATKTSSDRIPVDLVVVLDISGSMMGHKLQKLKTAVEFLIKKLGPNDRISVVTFNHSAHRLCPLRRITDQSQGEILHLVQGIHARGSTNITDGLQTGLKVLSDRTFSDDRVDAIMLMSDGEQNDGPDAARVVLRDDLPVYTFGFGTDQDPKVLKAIADNSADGTFSDVQNENDLSAAFAQCLAGLLIVAVQNLKLNINPTQGNSTIKEVLSGNYTQCPHGDGGITVYFSNLYNQEVRKVIVTLNLPAVTSEDEGVIVLNMTYTHGPDGEKDDDAAPLSVEIDRTDASEEPEKEELAMEMSRVRFVKKMKEARVSADENNMEDARKKLVEARKLLDESSNPNHHLIHKLKHEQEHLSHLMTSRQVYIKQGRSYALSFESSHGYQRYATRGDVEKHRMFATPRMHAHLKQAKEFDKDPTKPLPTEKKDRLAERATMLAHRRHP